MARLTNIRSGATFTLAFGACCLLLALWDLSDQKFGSTWPGGLTGPISAWLFDMFGHWGPRVALVVFGVFLVALSFWLASVARKNDVPSNP